jgi:hypothetical protein
MPVVFPLIYLHLKHPTQSTWALSKRIDSKTEGDIDFLASVRINFATEKNCSQDTDVPDNMSRLMYCFAIPSVVFFCCLVQRANFSICFRSCFEHIGFQGTPARRVIGQSAILRRGKYRMIIHSIQLCISFSLSLTCNTNDVIWLRSGFKRSSYSSSYISPTHLLTWLRRFVHPPLFLFAFPHLLQTHSPLFHTSCVIWNHRSKKEQPQLFAFEEWLLNGLCLISTHSCRVSTPHNCTGFNNAAMYTLWHSQHD